MKYNQLALRLLSVTMLLVCCSFCLCADGSDYSSAKVQLSPSAYCRRLAELVSEHQALLVDFMPSLKEFVDSDCPRDQIPALLSKVARMESQIGGFRALRCDDKQFATVEADVKEFVSLLTEALSRFRAGLRQYKTAEARNRTAAVQQITLAAKLFSDSTEMLQAAAQEAQNYKAGTGDAAPASAKAANSAALTDQQSLKEHLTPRWKESVKFTGDDYGPLVKLLGKPDIVDSTENDNPRPPLVTKLITYKKTRVRLTFFGKPQWSSW